MEKYQFPRQEQNTLERLKQPFAVYQLVDKRVVTLVLSDGFCSLFGYDDRAKAYYDMDNDMYKYDHPDDVARIADAALRFATEDSKYDVVYRTKNRHGSGYRIVHAFGEHVYTDTGVQLAQVWYSDEGTYTEETGQPVSALTRLLSDALHENSIVNASRYDELSGLPSMTYFFELSELGKERVRAAGGIPVILYLDFVGMKFFNAKHGFAEGDQLLRAFAHLLAEVFGNENCCRIGADHFTVFSEEAGLEQRLQRVFREGSEINGGKTLPVHVGVYSSSFEKAHTSVACDRAKLACTALRGRYETAVKHYSRDLSDDAVKKQYIIENIDRAISEKWIRIYLQPIIRAVNELVCDVETLARWDDPEKGVLSPADFIPALEDAGLIYKLDLYMVEQTLEAIHEEEADGFYVVPHSINLSRSDFDACDMVEEIRARVDAAGVERSLITIEITESVIGSNFDFIKTQVERFRALGFPVWMDDFGSGYSSLDVLQSIRFDLIKFDMSFMRKLDEGESGRVILTELMRMATSLGLDTVCEGVETEAQVRFLREIGCSKLQGFHYSRPIPFETLHAVRESNPPFSRENPAEAAYYESIGRVNLFDLGVISGGEHAVRGAADSLPIAVLELDGDTARYVRSNPSYQAFLKRFFNSDLLNGQIERVRSDNKYGQTFLSALQQCRENGNSIFFDETMPEGSVVHFFVRRVNSNPVTGAMAVVVAVLSVSEPDENESYADMARALAADYHIIYIVDLDTDRYMIYTPQADMREPIVERRGEHFFAKAPAAAEAYIYEDDRELFLTMLTRENVLRELNEHGVCIINCRLIDTGAPVYTSMKITRIRDTNRIIIGISNIDAHMKQLEEEEKLRQEKVSFSRIAALSPDFIVLYTVEPETGRYTQYSPSSEFAKYGLATQGENFFADVVLDAPKAIAPEDMERHLRVLTRENMLADIEKTGYFTHHYRLMMDGKYVPASLKATMIEESGEKKIILGVTNDENEEMRRKLEELRKIQEINQTVTSLLDNMPGLAFTKDAKTGVYLACNQAFAKYANKPTPSEVVGLTDAEIFDAETAAHFVEDDRLALSMDKPYIFFEDVPDAAGSQRQFQTTKFQFTDASGRLCLQGMCQDVTDMVRIQRENATTREAYRKASSTATIYNHIAHALARGCSDLYYVNTDTDELIEFHTDDARGVLSEARRGMDFFEECERFAKARVHPDDREYFLRAMKREQLTRALDGDRVFEMTYRIQKNGSPFYVQMKVSRMEDDPRILVIAVSDVDELMRQRRAEERVREERLIYARLHALTGNFIVVYIVDPMTNRYREFSATADYVRSFERDKEGTDFFASVRTDARVFAHPQDLDRFLAAFTKENVLSEIERSGIFTWGYRIMMDGKPLHIQMKAAMVEEKEGLRLIVGLNDIDAQVRQEEEYRKRLAQAQSEANLDALTGVKNRHAFLLAEASLDQQIAEHRQPPFAVVMFDVNDLKKVNDTAGHQAGDRYLRDACNIIRDIFRRSPVYRVGGDEFAVIAQGYDYERLDACIDLMRRHNEEASRDGGIIIACGMSKYEGDECLASILGRADQSMYENKNELKARRAKAE